MRCPSLLVFGVLACLAATASAADRDVVLERELVHIRNGAEREWAEFAAAPSRERFVKRFNVDSTKAACTLVLRQQDVKQRWRVVLNEKPLGELVRDENDLLAHFDVPPQTLLDGENVLAIEAPGKQPVDDIRVGEIRVVPRPASEWLSGGTVEVIVKDRVNQLLPCRLTITTHEGTLQPVGIEPSDKLAIRVGTIYSADGRATFRLPAGEYTLYAGRGFEYSLEKAEIVVAADTTVEKLLVLDREVPTPGYVACDTHLHTLTHSGHGDATLAERMVTIAGEGIELPIACDHNVHIDYETAAKAAGVRGFFTPVIGNELTTTVGHFNVFPLTQDEPVADHRVKTWPEIFAQVRKSPTAKIAILNHARDLHGGTRPFGPKLFNDAVAEMPDGWPIEFNAMEVINSGATQSDPLQLFHDWMALLNRGYKVAPIGSSDSHDVSRHFAGQGRTYVRCDDRDAGKIDVAKAIECIAEGKVMVSYGLLAELNVNGSHTCGDIAAVKGDTFTATVRVLGPSWVTAERVQLYINGELFDDKTIDRQPGESGDSILESQWKLPLPTHDVHLVAIALGAGVEGSYWKTAKPYQPTSPEFRAQTIGCSGAVYLDADGDGRFTSAREYAERLWKEADGDLAILVKSLADYDAAIAAHAAHLAHTTGKGISPDQLTDASRGAPDAVKSGIANYLRAYRETEIARVEK